MNNAFLYRYLHTLSLCLGFWLFVPNSYAEEVAQLNDTPASAEVLVFVDVSGSMKKNDPNNMRAPAIRMLAGMAPSNARVGIYLFGTDVRELVPIAVVDEAWKVRAEKASNQYRSRDMYTNIEAALLTAEKSWTNNAEAKRSIILLTDGIVDIDKNKIVSDASRERILKPVLQSLQQQNVTIHTIALSQNADHALLEELALKTDGKNHQVNSAELLQRTFMNLFEQSAPQDTVPLKDNSFTVDNSISELTLLVFRNADSVVTGIQSPGGELYSAETSRPGLKWKQDTGYDLISISEPESGVWQIIADEDPDNRAMVVTDLKFRTDELPAGVLNGEEINFKLWLEEQGNIINKADFLKLVSANITIHLKNGEERIAPVNSPDKDGYIHHIFGPEWPIGEYEMILKIDGGTFVREKRFSIQAYASPITVAWEEMTADKIQEHNGKIIPKNILKPEKNYLPEHGWTVRINAIPDLIDVNSSELQVEVSSQTNKTKEVLVTNNEQGWAFNYFPDEAGENSVSITLNTQSPSGRDITIHEQPFKLGEYVEIVELVDEPDPVSDPEPETPMPSMKNIIIPVIVGNVFFGIIFLAWKLFKRMRKNTQLQPEEAI